MTANAQEQFRAVMQIRKLAESLSVENRLEVAAEILQRLQVMTAARLGERQRAAVFCARKDLDEVLDSIRTPGSVPKLCEDTTSHERRRS